MSQFLLYLRLFRLLFLASNQLDPHLLLQLNPLFLISLLSVMTWLNPWPLLLLLLYVIQYDSWFFTAASLSLATHGHHQVHKIHPFLQWPRMKEADNTLHRQGTLALSPTPGEIEDLVK